MILDPLPDVLEPQIVTTTVEFPYRRTLGVVVGEFAAGLREKRLLASRTKSGRVQLPPLEYDPETGESVDGSLVEVGPNGTVESWAWVPHPSALHPFSRPFAFALIKVDGTDTATAPHAHGGISRGRQNGYAGETTVEGRPQRNHPRH